MSPRNPTNADILREIKEIKSVQFTQDNRLDKLEQWKIAEDAYKAALLQVYNEKKERLQEQATKAWIKVLKEVYPILVIVAAILYTYAQAHGVNK